MLWGFAVSVAHAGFWEREPREAYAVGAALVVALGPSEDRARFGVALDGQYQRFWADLPYYADGPVDRTAPLFTFAAHAGWTHPVVWTELTAVGGPMKPAEVGDGGFRPLVGLQAGTGVAFASDGAVGPVVVGAVVGPFVEARVESTIWRGWNAPRVLLGPQLSLSCCSYLL